MGWFAVSMSRRIRIHPKFFGVKLHEILTHRLMSEVEGTLLGKYGFVVAVLQVADPIPAGELENSTGYAIFTLQYQAVVFRPFKNEVMDAVVSVVTQHGFYARAGPLSVFVSHHLLPQGMRFDPTENSWKTHDNMEQIKQKSAVRLRILGLKIEAQEISATGSMKEPFLGPIDE